MEKHCLLDKIITDIELAEDKKAMRFLVEGADPIIARAEGDCCSSTWIEHIELPAMGFPVKILSVTDIDLPGSVNNSEDYDCLTVYGLKLTTDRGEIIVDFRNSSKGHYGGNLSWSDEFYGGVYGQNVSEDKWLAV